MREKHLEFALVDRVAIEDLIDPQRKAFKAYTIVTDQIVDKVFDPVVKGKVVYTAPPGRGLLIFISRHSPLGDEPTDVPFDAEAYYAGIFRRADIDIRFVTVVYL